MPPEPAVSLRDDRYTHLLEIPRVRRPVWPTRSRPKVWGEYGACDVEPFLPLHRNHEWRQTTPLQGCRESSLFPPVQRVEVWRLNRTGEQWREYSSSPTTTGYVGIVCFRLKEGLLRERGDEELANWRVWSDLRPRQCVRNQRVNARRVNSR